jgi:hypothetical protein
LVVLVLILGIIVAIRCYPPAGRLGERIVRAVKGRWDRLVSKCSSNNNKSWKHAQQWPGGVEPRSRSSTQNSSTYSGLENRLSTLEMDDMYEASLRVGDMAEQPYADTVTGAGVTSVHANPNFTRSNTGTVRRVADVSPRNSGEYSSPVPTLAPRAAKRPPGSVPATADMLEHSEA